MSYVQIIGVAVIGVVLFVGFLGSPILMWYSGRLIERLDGVGAEDEDLAQEALHEMGAYEANDPKHSDYHATMSDVWDLREGK